MPACHWRRWQVSIQGEDAITGLSPPAAMPKGSYMGIGRDLLLAHHLQSSNFTRWPVLLFSWFFTLLWTVLMSVWNTLYEQYFASGFPRVMWALCGLVALQQNRRICARIKVRREIMQFSPSENRQCGLWSTAQGEDKHCKAFLVFGLWRAIFRAVGTWSRNDS
jgi:hypothetical protein